MSDKLIAFDYASIREAKKKLTKKEKEAATRELSHKQRVERAAAFYAREFNGKVIK